MKFPLLDVLSGKEPDRRPVWLMRQAGRYLPEYREVRERAGSFLKLCYAPDMAAEVTLQPLRRYDLDAAIVFADILVVPHAMGVDLDFREGEGPVLSVVADAESVKALGDGAGSFEFGKVFETLSLVRAALPGGKALIGFCGAPWTVASYMVEGGGSDRKAALRAAVESPAWFSDLIDRLVDVSSAYLLGQIAAGAQVVQIFDSWAGDLPEALRGKWVADPIQRIVSQVRAVHPAFPVIVFARGIGAGHGPIARRTGASAVGVEQGLRLLDVLKDVPDDCAVQGNLAPEILLGSEQDVREGVAQVLAGVPMRRHVFNLGHGIVPQVKPGMVDVLLDAIRSHGRGDMS